MTRKRRPVPRGYEYKGATDTRVRFSEMTWPRGGEHAGVLAYALRYSEEPTPAQRVEGASFIDAYMTLIAMPARERNIVIAGLRRAEKEAIDAR
jgi:hypothetical protein